MRGPWLGRYQGNLPAEILIDIDEENSRFLGYGILRPDHHIAPQAPIAFARSDVPKGNQFTTSGPVFCIDPRDGNIKTWSDVSSLFPGYTFAPSVSVNASLTGAQLSVTWTDSSGATGVSTWQEFKTFANDARPYEFIFRGQSNNQWRLRTSFHRTGFSNLERYGTKTMDTVSRHLSALTNDFLDTRDPLRHGAFVTLIQHHGFPTPLLDWTYSPYVAAFFAYRSISKEDALKAGDHDRVRIFRFSKEKWGRIPQTLKLAPVPPHFSLLEALAIENARLIPQQGLSTITNVDDVETYIQGAEHAHSAKFLEAIDLPIAERQLVMRELAVMGVTAGALFPGLDGACAELRAN
jgi:hypothetical protein